MPKQKCPPDFPWTPYLLAIPAALAHQYAGADPELLDELTAHGNLALVRAAASYDPAKGASITTHLYGCVRWQMVAYFDSRRPSSPNHRPPMASLDQPYDGPGGLFPPLGRIALAREDPEPPAHHQEQVDALLARLDARDAQVLRLVYLEGLKLRQAGAKLGVSKERVRQMRNRALAILRGDRPTRDEKPATLNERILGWLRTCEGPQKTTEVMAHFPQERAAVRSAVHRLASAGRLRRVGKGRSVNGAPVTLFVVAKISAENT